LGRTGPVRGRTLLCDLCLVWRVDISYSVLLGCAYIVRHQRTGYEMNDKNAIVARGLSKRYDELWALRDVDFAVPAGSVLGLLGHNGAGTTTAIRILTTLAEPTSGEARVAGFDVATEGARVRERIGVAGQSATVDDLLTARANLEMVGRLYHLPKANVRDRADELLERLGLAGVGDKLLKKFSRGVP